MVINPEDFRRDGETDAHLIDRLILENMALNHRLRHAEESMEMLRSALDSWDTKPPPLV